MLVQASSESKQIAIGVVQFSQFALQTSTAYIHHGKFDSTQRSICGKRKRANAGVTSNWQHRWPSKKQSEKKQGCIPPAQKNEYRNKPALVSESSFFNLSMS
jgi:hypothetical protein